LSGNNDVKPLAGVRVLDMGIGMCAALAVKMLADHGAEVVRVEPPAGDPFYAVYPAYRIWQLGKRIRTYSAQSVQDEIAQADICVIGGEDFPDLQWHHDARQLCETAPRLIVLAIGAVPAGWNDAFPAVELLAQARSGFVFEHYPDRPALAALPFASYGAALHGVIAALAALWARHATGQGEIVSTSLMQGVLKWCASIWAEVERKPPGFDAVFPKGMVPLRFTCADGKYIHITVGVPGFYSKLFAILGIDGSQLDPGSRGAPGERSGPRDPAHYFDHVELIAEQVIKWKRADLFPLIQQAGLPGDNVNAPGECWDDPQTAINGVIRQSPDGWQYPGSPLSLSATDHAEPTSPCAPTRGPLDGVVIVDLGSFAAGPHASVILGDLGASVIKIERPEGDSMRNQYHHYVTSNRGKRSIAIDAKLPEGMEIIRRICRSADAVHHNFRPGVSARLGVDAESLSKINPGLVVLESPAYGPVGPKAQQPGYDSIFQATTGHQIPAGGDGNAPTTYRCAPMDYSTAIVGAFGILLGMLQRQRNHTGLSAWSSLLNSGICLMSELVRSPDGTFAGTPRVDAAQLGSHPAESLYRTSDGWIAIAARNEAMARRLLGVLNLDAAINTPRTQWSGEESSRIAAAIRDVPTAEMLARCEFADVWAVRCASDAAEVLADPAMTACGMVLDSVEAQSGRTRVIGRSVTMATLALPREGRATIDPIGGHTREILAEHGYSAAEIDDLFTRRIVA
jgi:crotonobetainyl-CoA:carnitine CoA-transferase CaiB-like acyl-CoA transferase